MCEKKSSLEKLSLPIANFSVNSGSAIYFANSSNKLISMRSISSGTLLNKGITLTFESHCSSLADSQAFYNMLLSSEKKKKGQKWCLER